MMNPVLASPYWTRPQAQKMMSVHLALVLVPAPVGKKMPVSLAAEMQPLERMRPVAQKAELACTQPPIRPYPESMQRASSDQRVTGTPSNEPTLGIEMETVLDSKGGAGNFTHTTIGAPFAPSS